MQQATQHNRQVIAVKINVWEACRWMKKAYNPAKKTRQRKIHYQNFVLITTGRTEKENKCHSQLRTPYSCKTPIAGSYDRLPMQKQAQVNIPSIHTNDPIDKRDWQKPGKA